MPQKGGALLDSASCWLGNTRSGSFCDSSTPLEMFQAPPGPGFSVFPINPHCLFLNTQRKKAWEVLPELVASVAGPATGPIRKAQSNQQGFLLSVGRCKNLDSSSQTGARSLGETALLYLQNTIQEIFVTQCSGTHL